MRAKRRFGQHFLEPAWVARLVDAVGPHSGDHVLEIGAGRGALTRPLARRVERLLAVEIDRDLGADLVATVPPNVSVTIGDVLDLDLGAVIGAVLRPPIRAVGNLPYNAAAPILFKLVHAADEGRVIAEAALMVQREVAARIAAGPGSGEYGILSVLVQRAAEVAVVLQVPPGAFRPVPKVESAVVRLTFRPPTVRPANPERFDALVRGIFAYRRKTVANALRHWSGLPSPVVAGWLDRAGVEARRRPETLHLVELARLADLFDSVATAPVL